VDSRYDDTRLGGDSLGWVVGEVGATARGTARRDRWRLGVGVRVGVILFALMAVVFVVCGSAALGRLACSSEKKKSKRESCCCWLCCVCVSVHARMRLAAGCAVFVRE